MFNKQPALQKNSRFECLHTPSNSSHEKAYSRPRRSRTFERSGLRSDKYSFMANRKKAQPKISLSDDMMKGKFPSLINVKSQHAKNKDNNRDDYLKVVNNDDGENKVSKDTTAKEEPKVGWLFMKNDKTATKMYIVDKEGKKIPVENADSHDDTPTCDFTHAQFQHECAIASYAILSNIQDKRDEELAVLGAQSKYYGKGKLTDLSYLTDSDYESSESDVDEQCHDYDTDDDTY